MIIGEDEDDVGSDVTDVAVPLQPRPEAIARQVAGPLSRMTDFNQERKEKKEERERGRQPPPCHHSTLQSPPQRFSHTATQSNLGEKTEGERAEKSGK